jgi:hypothetical protein
VSDIKLCKDCKHFDDLLSICNHDVSRDPVFGERRLSCETQRLFGYCGLTGLCWEAKK